MLKVSIWAKLAVVLVVAAGILIALPNALSDKVRGRFPSWLPSKTVSLGLDLQGGSYLLLEVDFDQVQKDKIEALVGDIRTNFRKSHISYTDLLGRGDRVTHQGVGDPRDVCRRWVVQRLRSGKRIDGHERWCVHEARSLWVRVGRGP